MIFVNVTGGNLQVVINKKEYCNMKILIDNGHGENTPGKCSPDGRLKEWAYTREIADRVVAGLRHRERRQNVL